MAADFKFDARLELDSLHDILAKRGLVPGGRVQKVIDEAVLRYCAPKAPFDTGYLIRSALQASSIDRLRDALRPVSLLWRGLRAEYPNFGGRRARRFLQPARPEKAPHRPSADL